MSSGKLWELREEVLSCNLCPRLRAYSSWVAKEGKRFKEEYWGKPVPGFGDAEAKLAIVGLAPAAHGGNRTGRPFTGDETGRWVIGGLYQLGLSNLKEGKFRGDGLALRGVFLTNTVLCAPPQNRVRREEVANCSRYLRETLRSLPKLRVVLTLGSVTFNAVAEVLGIDSKFAHGTLIHAGELILMSSYHPSPLNTRTGRLSWNQWIEILRHAWKLASGGYED